MHFSVHDPVLISPRIEPHAELRGARYQEHPEGGR